ncbi:transcriptional regulator [Chlorobaculum sp. 24CR]|jgi:CsoR family transcriptional regulator, copper-sensing transcriptional repressor|uniref:metal-sensitive transcriptional regulator n=1 Tax=Chlorobaculum sp. 24CR TaxID=2508878 RepID=UPI00100AFBA4|nr:transcriptional regulator [Chlorobaculum sp. 24CR]
MNEECRMDDVIVRLKKVNGQIQALTRMIEGGEECDKVVTQFQAAKAALDNTFSLVLNRNLQNCLNRHDSGSVEKIIKLISKK